MSIAWFEAAKVLSELQNDDLSKKSTRTVQNLLKLPCTVKQKSTIDMQLDCLNSPHKSYMPHIRITR